MRIIKIGHCSECPWRRKNEDKDYVYVDRSNLMRFFCLEYNKEILKLEGSFPEFCKLEKEVLS